VPKLVKASKKSLNLWSNLSSKVKSKMKSNKKEKIALVSIPAKKVVRREGNLVGVAVK